MWVTSVLLRKFFSTAGQGALVVIASRAFGLATFFHDLQFDVAIRACVDLADFHLMALKHSQPPLSSTDFVRFTLIFSR
jgi:hypothetical protein